MRLPLSKIYRAFPELDRFTDVQCEEYVRQVRKRFRRGRRVQGVLRTLGAVLIAFACFVGSVALAVSIGWTTGGVMRISTLVEHPLLGAVSIAAFTAIPASVILLWLKNGWLRRRIRDHMRDIRCAQCGYVMLGLNVHDGVITCPECGERVVLESLGLTAADVMGVVGAEGRKPPV